MKIAVQLNSLGAFFHGSSEVMGGSIVHRSVIFGTPITRLRVVISDEMWRLYADS